MAAQNITGADDSGGLTVDEETEIVKEITLMLKTKFGNKHNGPQVEQLQKDNEPVVAGDDADGRPSRRPAASRVGELNLAELDEMEMGVLTNITEKTYKDEGVCEPVSESELITYMEEKEGGKAPGLDGVSLDMYRVCVQAPAATAARQVETEMRSSTTEEKYNDEAPASPEDEDTGMAVSLEPGKNEAYVATNSKNQPPPAGVETDEGVEVFVDKMTGMWRAKTGRRQPARPGNMSAGGKTAANDAGGAGAGEGTTSEEKADLFIPYEKDKKKTRYLGYYTAGNQNNKYEVKRLRQVVLMHTNMARQHSTLIERSNYLSEQMMPALQYALPLVDVKSDELSKWQSWCDKAVLDGMDGAYYQRPARYVLQGLLNHVRLKESYMKAKAKLLQRLVHGKDNVAERARKVWYGNKKRGLVQNLARTVEKNTSISMKLLYQNRKADEDEDKIAAAADTTARPARRPIRRPARSSSGGEKSNLGAKRAWVDTTKAPGENCDNGEDADGHNQLRRP